MCIGKTDGLEGDVVGEERGMVMKVNRTSVFVGETVKNSNEKADFSNRNQKNTSVFAGDLKTGPDLIGQKKQRAQEQAMKIVGDAFAGDRKIDADLEARRDKIRQLKDEISLANEEVKALKQSREKLREEYGVQEGSAEQEELALLEKEADAKLSFKKIHLTKEEREELARIKSDGLTEYQQRSMEMKEFCGYYETQIYDMDMQIKEEEAVIRGTKLERLKSSPMVKAEKQADAILEAAGKDVIDMLMEEAKEHIDEEMEEKKEAAKEAAEKKEVAEEKLKKAKEEREKEEALTELLTNPAMEIAENGALKSDVQDEVAKMLNKMMLLEEDVKGAAVDESL